jgi:hypothetical protein
MVMTNKQLTRIFQDFAGTVNGSPGRWELIIKDVHMTCITDEMHNRMRLISPITTINKMTVFQMKKCMEANFHTTIDARYSFSDGQLYGAYIHPLKELSEFQFKIGVQQLFSIVKTYGSSYSGGALKFPTEDEFRTGLN